MCFFYFDVMFCLWKEKGKSGAEIVRWNHWFSCLNSQSESSLSTASDANSTCCIWTTKCLCTPFWPFSRHLYTHLTVLMFVCVINNPLVPFLWTSFSSGCFTVMDFDRQTASISRPPSCGSLLFLFQAYSRAIMAAVNQPLCPRTPLT